MADNSQSGQMDVTVYRRLVLDRRVSHGAFRLWHYLRDRQNASRQCWPSQRTISTELHCKPHSLSGWIVELANAGYLRTETKGQNHYFVYTVLDGVMPKQATPRVAETGSTNKPHCPNGQRRVMPIPPLVMPKQATPRVAQMGNESNTSEVIPLSKGKLPPALKPVERISHDATIARINTELKTLGQLSDHDRGDSSYKKIVELNKRKSELLAIINEPA